MSNYTITDNYDLTFDENGFLSISEDEKGFSERLKFDLESNANWIYRSTLGCDWANEKGNGLLQQKGINDFIEGYIKTKTGSYLEVDTVTSISLVADPQTREATINLSLKLINYEEVDVEVSV